MTAPITISAWGLSWDAENYYLIGYDSEAGKIKHYRVDKMLRLQMSDEKREGKEHFKKLDMQIMRRRALACLAEGREGEAPGGKYSGRRDHRPVWKGYHADSVG